MPADPATLIGALAAIAGSASAAIKLLSRRSRLSQWVRRRQEEDRVREEAIVEMLSILGRWAGVEGEIQMVRRRMLLRLDEIARAHAKRPGRARWR